MHKIALQLYSEGVERGCIDEDMEKNTDRRERGFATSSAGPDSSVRKAASGKNKAVPEEYSGTAEDGKAFAVRAGVFFDQRFANDHEKRCGHAFAGYIGHDNGQMALVHHEEVVEIASYLADRIHDGIQIKFLALREIAGQHGCYQ